MSQGRGTPCTRCGAHARFLGVLPYLLGVTEYFTSRSWDLFCSELKCLSARRYCKPMKARQDGTATCSKESWPDAEQKKQKKDRPCYALGRKLERRNRSLGHDGLGVCIWVGTQAPSHPVAQRNPTDGSGVMISSVLPGQLPLNSRFG